MRNWVNGITVFRTCQAVLTAGLLSFATQIAAAEPGAPLRGVGMYEFSGWAGPSLKLWYVVPDGVDAHSAILVVMHGTNRNADDYRDSWLDLAPHYNIAVVTPEFDRKNFPGGRGYNLGNRHSADGAAIPEAQWAFTAVEALFEDFRHRIGSAQQDFYMFGHSAGGQFVHRYLLFKPDAPVSRAVAANAGWYTMPDPSVAFPYGLKNAGLTEAGLKSFLAKELIILLGDRDIDAQSSSLNRGPEAVKQGPFRLARGVSFYQAGLAQAGSQAAPLNWQIMTVRNVAHSNGQMAPAAAMLLFAQPGAP